MAHFDDSAATPREQDALTTPPAAPAHETREYRFQVPLGRKGGDDLMLTHPLFGLIAARLPEAAQGGDECRLRLTLDLSAEHEPQPQTMASVRLHKRRDPSDALPTSSSEPSARGAPADGRAGSGAAPPGRHLLDVADARHVPNSHRRRPRVDACTQTDLVFSHEEGAEEAEDDEELAADLAAAQRMEDAHASEPRPTTSFVNVHCERTEKIKGKPWRGCVTVKGKSHFTTRFGTDEEAARAVDDVVRKLRLEHAKPLNFPRPDEPGGAQHEQHSAPAALHSAGDGAAAEEPAETIVTPAAQPLAGAHEGGSGAGARAADGPAATSGDAPAEEPSAAHGASGELGAGAHVRGEAPGVGAGLETQSPPAARQPGAPFVGVHRDTSGKARTRPFRGSVWHQKRSHNTAFFATAVEAAQARDEIVRSLGIVAEKGLNFPDSPDSGAEAEFVGVHRDTSGKARTRPFRGSVWHQKRCHNTAFFATAVEAAQARDEIVRSLGIVAQKGLNFPDSPDSGAEAEGGDGEMPGGVGASGAAEPDAREPAADSSAHADVSARQRPAAKRMRTARAPGSSSRADAAAKEADAGGDGDVDMLDDLSDEDAGSDDDVPSEAPPRQRTRRATGAAEGDARAQCAAAHAGRAHPPEPSVTPSAPPSEAPSPAAPTQLVGLQCDKSRGRPKPWRGQITVRGRRHTTAAFATALEAARARDALVRQLGLVGERALNFPEEGEEELGAEAAHSADSEEDEEDDEDDDDDDDEDDDDEEDHEEEPSVGAGQSAAEDSEPGEDAGELEDDDQPPRGNKLSSKQLSTLVRSFHRQPYPTADARALLAKKLGLREGRIFNWFKQRRRSEVVKASRAGAEARKPPVIPFAGVQVKLDKPRNRPWCGMLYHAGARHRTKMYETAEEAARARDDLIRELGLSASHKLSFP